MLNKILVFSVSLLCGCGFNNHAQLQQIGNAADSERSQKLRECSAKYPKGVRGKAVAGTRCANEANLAFHRALPNAANFDLIEVANARAIVAAEKFDGGRMTEAEFDLEIAQISSETAQGFADRGAQAAGVQAAQQQAAAAQQRAASEMIAAGAKAMAPPPPTSTSCTSMGNTVNCRHY